MTRGLALAALAVTLAVAPVAAARDPGRWVDTGFTTFTTSYNQGIAPGPGGSLYFDGTALTFNGLFRTDRKLRQTAAASPEIPADVKAREGYNHIGDLSFEGGRVLLPLECYTIGAPNGGNTCGTGAFGVADPVTLRWRYYVKLDPADIRKAMWVEASPGGKLLWTSSGQDLIAYNATDVNPGNAAPDGPLLHPAVRLPGAVPPSGVTGATFYRGRLLLAGSAAGRFQIWSVDTVTGKRRLEVERRYVGEPEGLATFSGLGGLLHAQILPSLQGKPTFGSRRGALVNFAPRGSVRLHLRVTPRRAPVGRRRSFVFRVTFAAFGGRGPVSGVRIRFAGRRAVTNRRGRAVIRTDLRHAGRYGALATRRGFRKATASVRAR